MVKFIVALVAIVAMLLYFAEQKPTPVTSDPTPVPAVASKPKVQAPKHGKIDCAEAPEQAITNDDLDEQQSALFSVECYTYGHVLGAQPGYVWNLSTERHGEHFIPTPLTLAARRSGEVGVLPGGAPFVHHDAYFVSVKHRPLDDAEVEALLETIAQSYTSMPQPVEPTGVEILAVNNLGVEQRVLIANIKTDLSVGYGCRPECETDNLFSVMEWKTFWSVSEEERRALDVPAPDVE